MRYFGFAATSRLVRCALVLSVAVLLSNTAQAATVYGTSADLTGTRSVGSGLVVSNSDSDWANAQISWLIVNNGDGTYDYEYTMPGFHRPAISHFVLDITDGITVTSWTISNAKLNGTAIPASKVEIKPSTSIGGILGAVKFDVGGEGTLVYTFTSDRQPVWGDVHVKGGTQYLRNTGFGIQSNNPLDYIARPDGNGPVPSVSHAPAPAALWGGLGLLAGLGVYRRVGKQR
jgi:hypothetical protein